MKQETFSPLSLIAIFAGLIEASALASLPFLSENSQAIYTWFLVGFPFFLTVLFFLTLNFNAQSLFSPEGPAARAEPRPAEPAHAHAQAQAPSSPMFVAPGTAQGPIIIALTGAESRKAAEEHFHSLLKCPQATPRHWVLYNLDQRTCIQLSVGPMQDGAHTAFNGPDG